MERAPSVDEAKNIALLQEEQLTRALTERDIDEQINYVLYNC